MSDAAPLIHVVDDDASFRRAVRRLLQASGYRVADYGSGDELLRGELSGEPGCILLDIHMSGLSGLQLQTQLNAMGSILPIVFLTGHGDIRSSVKAIKAGAEDFLPKPVSKAALFEAVEQALARHRELRARREQIDSLRAKIEALTPREREVFTLVVRGKLNKQIAFELGTSERTIKAHRHGVMQKLKVRSVAEAVSIAERLGIMPASTVGEGG